MRWSSLVLVSMLCIASWTGAEQATVIWEQKFDVPALDAAAWKIEGASELRDSALCTRSDPAGPVTDGATSLIEQEIPTGADGWIMRFECALVPVKIGGWGQDIRVGEGPFVIEFTGPHPSLNTRHSSRDAVTEGKETVISLDFTQNKVFDWRINGKSQLDGSVDAWHPGIGHGRVALSDFKDTNSETRWLWVRISKVIPDDPLPARLSGWDSLPNIQPGQTPSFLVGRASPMDKVFREAADFHGELGGLVHIAAAGRERESFQLVVLPLKGALKDVSVECTDLVHSDGKTRLTSDRVAWHPVGYVQTKPSNSAIRRVGWWWPDVLMPAAPVDIDAGFVQPLWFTVDVPADAAPGVYRGLIDIKAGDEAPVTTGVEVTVRPFSLPLRGKLKTAFCICAGMWEMWYKPEEVKQRLGLEANPSHGPLYSAYECEDILPPERWREMYDFLLAHRLNPLTIYSGMKNGRTRVVPKKEDIDYCYERGMNATCLANVDVLPSDPAAADESLKKLSAWIKEWEPFVKERNWPDFTWFVHGFDESEMRPEPEKTVDPSIHSVMGMLAKEYPWLKRESANPFTPKHAGMFSVWTPLTAQLTDEKLPAYRERQAAGDEVWAYVCCGPGRPYANLFIDFPGVDPRILGWQFHQYKLTGFLYYLINMYQEIENWNQAAPKWPDRPWNTLSFNTNSDGILIYPGPNATPLASTRLESLRDGIEDYEALAMLDTIVNRVREAGGHDEFVTRAAIVLAVKPEVSKSWTEYTQEPSKITAARAEVDALIEEGMKLVP